MFHSDESNILGHFYNELYVAAAVVATKLKKKFDLDVVKKKTFKKFVTISLQPAEPT